MGQYDVQSCPYNSVNDSVKRILSLTRRRNQARFQPEGRGACFPECSGILLRWWVGNWPNRWMGSQKTILRWQMKKCLSTCRTYPAYKQRREFSSEGCCWIRWGGEGGIGNDTNCLGRPGILFSKRSTIWKVVDHDCKLLCIPPYPDRYTASSGCQVSHKIKKCRGDKGTMGNSGCFSSKMNGKTYEFLPTIE